MIEPARIASQPLTSLVQAAMALLDQCARLVGVLSPDDFRAESGFLAGGTIGGHVRHLLDHYNAIVRACGQDGVVEYDRRERGVPLERDPVAALQAIRSLSDELNIDTRGRQDRALSIRLMIAGDGEELALASSLSRELAFATHHGVHHLAMMRAIAIERGVSVEYELGRAPSTLNHERQILR